MRYINKNQVVFTVALGALTVSAATVGAQTVPTVTTTTTTTMVTTSASAPVAVTGTVRGYYTDRSGYVTAMDIQTADGVRWIHFAPNTAQRLAETYPVGSTATVYVTNSPRGWNMVGYGPAAPTLMWTPTYFTDLDLLKAPPYTTLGAQPVKVTGKLTGYVQDERGEVLALVLDHDQLVRLGRENRQFSKPGDEGIAPLRRGAAIQAIGYPEAPWYGAISPYRSRTLATAVVSNGSSIGSKGFGIQRANKRSPLLGFDIMGKHTSLKPDEIKAGDNGYMVYTPTVVAPPAQ